METIRMSEKGDIKNIGLSEDNKVIIDKLTDTYFEFNLDVAKFAMGLAIGKQTPYGSTPNTVTTWRSTDFIEIDDLKLLIAIIYPDIEYPYRMIEHLINEGCKILDNHLKDNPIPDFNKLILDL